MTNLSLTSSRRDTTTDSTVRPEIQALRAIAVVAVMLYHLWPSRLTGGFVGVDVFFVISGYLIIGHLLREIHRTGTVSLAAFWARRIRRLLPASLLVLAVSGAAIVAVVPQVLWTQWFQEIGASASYIQNWLLAANAVDYLGANNAASPAQHYWSLSVEEQFYIVWPILILAVLSVARKRGPRLYLRIIGLTLAVVTIASFVYSVVEVAGDPAAAYFVTPSRAWEFGAGGLLAYFAANQSLRFPKLKAATSWLGLVFVAAAVTLYTPHTAFPGAAALLPVGGTLLVIWAGLPRITWSPRAILSLRPVGWLGDVSYSLYLWHWPAIVLVPYMLGHPLSGRTRVGILVFAVVAAWLTKKFVEDPVRRGSFLISRPARISFVTALAASLLVIAGSGVATSVAQTSVMQAANAIRAAVDSSSRCIGAPAQNPRNNCVRPHGITSLTSSTFAQTDIGKGVQVTDSCKQTLDDSVVVTCELGDHTNPSTRIALVGDSHAGQFIEALDQYGKRHDIEFVTYVKTLCAGTGSPVVSSMSGGTAVAIDSCADWGRRVLSSISTNPRISSVLFSNYTATYLGPKTKLSRPLASDDFVIPWRTLIEAGKQVIAIRDTPNANFVNAPQCIAQQLAEYDPCTTPRELSELAAASDPMLLAVQQVPSVKLIDLTDNFCDATTCHTIIGGLIVYFDDAHMTSSFSKTLAPILGAAITSAIEAR